MKRKMTEVRWNEETNEGHQTREAKTKEARSRLMEQTKKKEKKRKRGAKQGEENEDYNCRAVDRVEHGFRQSNFV